MNVHLSPFISASRKNYNTQHVLLRLLEEWREHLNNNKTVGGILMDLSKAFDCFPHDLLLAKLATYGIDDNLILYICILISLGACDGFTQPIFDKRFDRFSL